MKLSLTAKRMFSVIGVCSLVFSAAAFFVYLSLGNPSEALWFALGVVLMSALNCAKVLMLERIVERSVEMDSFRGKHYIGLQYIFRLVLTAAVLAAAVIVAYQSDPPSFSMLWGAAIGIFGFQIAAHSLQFFFKRDVKREEDEAHAHDSDPPES